MLAMFRSLSEDKCIITEKDKKATKAQHTCVNWWAQVLKSTTASLWTHFHSDWSPVTTIEQSYIKTKCLYSFSLLEVPIHMQLALWSFLFQLQIRCKIL